MTMIGTGWGNSCPGCMNGLSKHYSHLVGGLVLAGKAAWALNGCLPTENSDYCMLVNEWLWFCLLRLKMHLGSVLESEFRQKLRYGKGIYVQKLVSSEQIRC